jgi:rsbT co-antagonist protein RsbR
VEDDAFIRQILASQREAVLQEWLTEVGEGATMQRGASADAREMLDALHAGFDAGGDPSRVEDQQWAALRSILGGISKSRAAQGATAGETSRFVLSLKKPLFSRLQSRRAVDSARVIKEVWDASTFVDALAAFTATAYQRSREDIITRQQQELLELSTPVVKLWEGVLAVPMIGTLDSSRTQLVMETLLQRIVETGSAVAIIDITGVPTVDTLVAQHLLKTVAAIRLMGADCIISGIRPQIAQTIVHLGIDLEGVTTKASLADALAVALKRSGYAVSQAAP